MKTLLSFVAITSSVVLMSFGISSNFTTPDQGKWVAPASAKELKNPHSGAESVANGKSIYTTRCVVCHGATGMGDGPAGKSLNPPAADHGSAAVQSQTDGELFWKISEGRGAMVGWKLILSENDRWDLVNYIRTLKR
ncbi:MAG: cytochrome c [Cyclobacteriaceae bacterium]|nr:cytochrome c [Cyclobacteriaceae bacterium]